MESGGRDRRCSRHGSHYGGSRGPTTSRPPGFRRSYSSVRGRHPRADRGGPPEVHPGACPDRLVPGTGPVRADRLGDRCLRRRSGRPAPPGGPLARRPDSRPPRRDGELCAGDDVRPRDVRHHPAERPHGPAHGAHDGRPAGAGARRTGHAGPPDAAEVTEAVAAGRPPLTRRTGADVPAAHVPALRRLALGALLLGLVPSVAGVAVPPRGDARPPGRGRRAVLLAAGGHRPGAGAGELPVPGAAGRADPAVPRVPRRDDHGPADAPRR